jgi:hypothetical protein
VPFLTTGSVGGVDFSLDMSYHFHWSLASGNFRSTLSALTGHDISSLEWASVTFGFESGENWFRQRGMFAQVSIDAMKSLASVHRLSVDMDLET